MHDLGWVSIDHFETSFKVVHQRHCQNANHLIFFCSSHLSLCLIANWHVVLRSPGTYFSKQAQVRSPWPSGCLPRATIGIVTQMRLSLLTAVIYKLWGLKHKGTHSLPQSFINPNPIRRFLYSLHWNWIFPKLRIRKPLKTSKGLKKIDW